MVITITMHQFCRFEGVERAARTINFWKNPGMIGGLLVVAWVYSESGDPALSLSEGVLE